MSATGLGTFWDNLKALPQNLKESASRHETPSTDRSRSQAIFANVFLHIHATRVHVRTLKFSTTMAMGVATLSFFFILVVTGVLLMVYYKPSVAEAYNSIKDIYGVFVAVGSTGLLGDYHWGQYCSLSTRVDRCLGYHSIF